jgi:hypothetical protein
MLITAHSGWSQGLSYESLIAQAKSDLAGGRLDQALAGATQAIKLDQARWEGYTIAAGASIKQHRCEEAGDYVQKAIARAPETKKPGLMAMLSMCSGEEQTVNGWVSDSRCGVKGAREGAAACTKKCVENGAKMVVVTDGDRKVFTVENPDSLKGREGYHITVTGHVAGASIHVLSAKLF